MAYVKRDIEPELEKWLGSREIIAIRGPRQSGKTTLLQAMEARLKEKGIGEDDIHYISFEDDITRIKFEEDTKEFINFHMSGGRKQYFLLDEVQYVKDIGKRLKLAFDTFSEAKFIISGSSSFDLTNMGSYLVGRIVFFNLYPFSFSEFLRAKSPRHERLYKELHIDISKKSFAVGKTIFLGELNKLLHECLTFGTYPRIATEQDKEKKKELLKSLFVTYVEKDVVALYGNKYRENAVKLLQTLSATLGSVVKYETLSANSGLKYREVREIMPLLEDSFIVFIVKPFYKNLLNEIRKNPKIYFVDYGIRNYLLQNFDSIAFDTLYENFVHNQLKRSCEVRYWRTTAKAEVDFVAEQKGKIVPVEVKTKPKVTSALKSFIRHYKPENALIPNLAGINKTRLNSCNVLTVPFVYL